MPIYEYKCAEAHRVEEIRTYDERDKLLRCRKCGRRMKRIPSAHYRQPDGIYSYDPNMGSKELAEKGRAREQGYTWDTLANPKKDV